MEREPTLTSFSIWRRCPTCPVFSGRADEDERVRSNPLLQTDFSSASPLHWERMSEGQVRRKRCPTCPVFSGRADEVISWNS